MRALPAVFDEIDNPKNALYDLFRVHTLRPLDTKECAVLWESVSGRCVVHQTIRSLEILTGGSPRLLTIVARFGAGRSLRDLMADLLNLVDDHTEYFKGHIESLPAQERRVYLALADLWKPVTTREVADRCRLETSKCSAQLTRLIERGVVQVEGGTARRKQYYLTERLYNIYYLLRRSRGPDSLIEAIIRFMESYFSSVELKDIVARLIHEAGGSDAEMQSLYRIAIPRLLESPVLGKHRGELLTMVPDGSDAVSDRVSVPSDAPGTAAAGMKVGDHRAGQPQAGRNEAAVREAMKLFDRAATLDDQNRAEDALVLLDELLLRFGQSTNPTLLGLVAFAFVNKGALFAQLNRPQDALATFDEMLRLFGQNENPETLGCVAQALFNKGLALRKLHRPQDALATWDEVVRRFAESENATVVEVVAKALFNKGDVLVDMDRLEDALTVWDEAFRRFGESQNPDVLGWVAQALVVKGAILEKMERIREALTAFGEAVHRLVKNTSALPGEWMEEALLRRAGMEFKCLQYEAAIETAGLALELRPESLERQARCHMIRAKATLAHGNRSACERDIEAVLTLLRKIDSLPPEALDTLMYFSVELGPERMRELIQASPSANLLVPLTTALERELGLEPRVAREVEEIAQDIRRDLAKLREARTMASSGEKPASPASVQTDRKDD